jgi:S1-C subfamily serine protease
MRLRHRVVVVFLLLIACAIGQQATNTVIRSDDKVTAEMAQKSTVQVNVPGIGKGSGVWISRDGCIATCWHVVKDVSQRGQVVIRTGEIFNYKFKSGEIFSASARASASVVAHDEDADVAILRADVNYPQAGSRKIYKGPLGTLKSQFDVPQLREEFPQVGDRVALAGYPMGNPYLLFQFGNIAGVGLLEDGYGSAGKFTYQLGHAEKKVRLFASMTSNPGNSGGPVFDREGNVLGLLAADFLSPMKDENERYIYYYRPKRDDAGKFLPAQPEISDSPLAQNSGISIFVPTHYLIQALEIARKTNVPAPSCQSNAALMGRLESFSAGLRADYTSYLEKEPKPPEPRQEIQRYESEIKRYDAEFNSHYQKELALQALILRNDLADCGIHSQRLDRAYPDWIPGLVDRLLEVEIPALRAKLQ